MGTTICTYLLILVVCYISCFKDSIKQENAQEVIPWIIGTVIVVLILSVLKYFT